MKKILLLLIAVLSPLSAFADFSVNINDREIIYDEDALKFYENNKILDKDEVSKLFCDYEIIPVSQFDKYRKYTIKNTLFGSKKVLLLNDTKRTFHNFFIYPLSSRAEFQGTKDIKSLIIIYGKKNVRLKHEGGDEFEIVVK